MYLTYDSEADAIYLALRNPEDGESGCRQLDENRITALDGRGDVFAYEFLFVSNGVSLAGIDAGDAASIREAIDSMRQVSVA